MGIQDAVDSLGQLVNGEIITDGKTFPVTNPSTGEVVALCPAASVDMVDRAMAAAADALPAWSATPEEERRELIRKMCDSVEAGFEAVDLVASAEKGQSGAAGEAILVNNVRLDS